ncbi:hypothetical protein ON010_g2966 [Phytophthora cinnamomi]|nr:hypothetical protein ON010_g2966 [Phytophthora cinnamomi]
MNDSIDTVRVRIGLLRTQVSIMVDAIQSLQSLQSQINEMETMLTGSVAEVATAEYDSDELASVPRPQSPIIRGRTRIQRRRPSVAKPAIARQPAKNHYVIVPPQTAAYPYESSDSD